MLFDTGYADHFWSATRAFPERMYWWATPMRLPERQRLAHQLARFKLLPGDVELCLVSHFHGDHVAGLKDLPGARVVASGAALDEVYRFSRLRAVLGGVLPTLLPPDLPSRFTAIETLTPVLLPAPWNALGMGFDLFGDRSVLCLPLPGHTAGHMGILIKDQNGRDVLLSADSSWSYRAVRENRMPSCIARPLMHDWGQYRRTLQVLHELATRHEELVLLPSHCEASLCSYDATWSRQ
jgi:glyoxylase-like metal-dependent hydrolase (beta-lactamase superfamily II)